jgi:DNA-3-methyladenine glycosylase
MTILDLLSQDALVAAPKLLGWQLVSHTAEGEAGGTITEVEAYHGDNDPASHAFRGLTPRTKPMFEEGGTIYVYFTYGMHYCTNLVTGPPGDAQAILLRALVPTIGVDLMAARRGPVPLGRLTNGPANLTQALGIAKAWSGRHLRDGLLELIPPTKPINPRRITSGPRIGIKQAIDLPWRFVLETEQK